MQDFNLKSTGHMGIEQLSQSKVHENNVHFQRENIKCTSLRLLESKNKYVCPIKTYIIITIFLHKKYHGIKMVYFIGLKAIADAKNNQHNQKVLS